MTREEAAIRAQANADTYGRVWFAISYDGRSYLPVAVLVGKSLTSYMQFEPRSIATLEKQSAPIRSKGHKR